MPSRLGYKGFLIQDLTEQSSEIDFRPRDGGTAKGTPTDHPGGMLKGKFEAFKDRLLRKEIIPGKVKAVQLPTNGKQKRYAYPFDATPWGTPIQWVNNCYNYANNKITNILHSRAEEAEGGVCCPLMKVREMPL